MPANINFFVEGIDFNLKNKNLIRKWIVATAHSEGFKIRELNFIFCQDTALLEINRSFLNHDTFTDIITFDYSETKYKISGEIYISIDRVKENATLFNTEFFRELERVIIHGVLHLCGYKDSTTEEKKLMREKEDFAMADYNSITQPG